MRRRGRSIPTAMPYSHTPYNGRFHIGGYFRAPPLVISEVPQAWQEHAREPWRILFPDLAWTPPPTE